jgi:Subtilase family
MVANQQQADRKKEIHRLDFFRPDQLVCLVTHETVQSEPPPGVTLREWVAGLSEQISQNEELSNTSARVFVSGLCEQLNDDEHLPQAQLNDWTVEFGKQMDAEGWKLVDPQPRSYTFPPVNGLENADQSWQEIFKEAFSLIICNLEKKDQPDRIGALNILKRVGVFAKDNDEPDETNDDKTDESDNVRANEDRITRKLHLLDLISRLNEPTGLAKLNFAGLTMQAVTPNWIVSSGKSDSGGTGGPGSKPAPYIGNDPQNSYKFLGLVEKLRGNDENPTGIDLYGEGDGVDVVILDTAPSGDDLVLAYKELVLKKKPGEEHPIVRDLLGPNGRLKLYPATYEELLRMGNTSLNKHGYKMSDHGLFIAGIINSIVPKATIHLIQVLNQFGVGDVETISRGFAKAYGIYRSDQRKLIVSGSILLDMPPLVQEFGYRETNEEEIRPIEKQFQEALRNLMITEERKRHPNATIKELQESLYWVLGLRVMCERLAKVGRQVVAAAGNDSRKTPDGQRNPRAARYPAAFTQVIGVGSMPKDAKRGPNNKYEASSFSNLADAPARNGILALGGEPGAEQGVLGIYLGEFPEEDAGSGQTTATNSSQATNEYGWAEVVSNNKNGWAWWAGTSFATPILTATIASVLSGPASSQTTQSALSQLYTAHVILNALSSETEDGIPSSVHQGI